MKIESLIDSRAFLASPIQLAIDKQTYGLGELFAGAGGMALGASKAEWDENRFHHVWVNDNDKDACVTLSHNMSIPRQGVYCCDVANLDFDSMQPIDGLVFGFPCNDFSMVGDRHGISGQYGGLYRWGVRALESLKPLFFVAENVTGLGSSGNDLATILNALKGAGYKVFPNTYHFERYGVPQRRHRIIIVGFREDLNIGSFQHPNPTTKEEPITSRQALEGITQDVSNNERTKQSTTVIERLKHIRPGENAFTANLPEHLRLNLKSGATISIIYRRLKPDEPSYTVTGSGGGGTHLYHWKEPRALTNRERARLQTFPDDFVFYGNKESVRRQIGMAVPPHGATIIFETILSTLVKAQIPSQC